ncbi:uncharacterized protein EI97DRAFT_33315 [Westerdykella ornata]|uniref:Alpha/beta hydrolase fold-3 domain-containing protein n=1 Tax=Westerdykella ornata TaxID=318751 RepID=A0A6A6JY68_WESOR|nr:uncharacterized protein EI97DRAFT_33315 [Westerdykella ornata]KAF2281560.1 hypothetical protein EI97DRAFT_33315 [Westerdykella ornata]
MPEGDDRPRWMLHLQAQVWRFLMSIGMTLHRQAPPRPPNPAFTRTVDATVSPLKGRFRIHFYVPKDYKSQRKLKGTKRYPCVVNFHGGGFVLGTATDDARWIGAVVEQVDAVVVSVDYRLAPEYPFPTAVEDGADAILYLAKHAEEFLLDTERFAVSGFSSGGNMSFTVPLCLQGELLDRTAKGEKIEGSHAGSTPARVKVEANPGAAVPKVQVEDSTGRSRPQTPQVLQVEDSAGNGETIVPVVTAQDDERSLNISNVPSSTSDGTDVNGNSNPNSNTKDNPHPSTDPDSKSLRPLLPSRKPSRNPLTRANSRLDRIAYLRQTGTSSLSLVSSLKDASGPSVSITTPYGTSLKILGIISFYPPTDYTQTREQRRQTCVRADQNLPAVFTRLFDDSYLQPPSLDLAHPWLSPGRAPREMLQVLPDDIVMMCCEWDMLLAEGERFRDRLRGEVGKNVRFHCVPGVPHGWDKAPNPLRESPGAREQYGVACGELRRMFYGEVLFR